MTLIERLRAVARQKREDLHKTSIVMSGDGDLYDEAALAIETLAKVLEACKVGAVYTNELATLIDRALTAVRPK